MDKLDEIKKTNSSIEELNKQENATISEPGA